MSGLPAPLKEPNTRAVPLDAQLTPEGDLPVGIHRASVYELLSRFAQSAPRRIILGERLKRVYEAAVNTGRLERFIVFGSFVSDAEAPNDVDVFLVMDNAFDASHLTGDAALVFDHPVAQVALGVSVFWMSRAAVEVIGELVAIEEWQIKRNGTRRRIVEVIPDDSD